MNVKNIDSYKLIDAVSKRPALYDKQNQMYTDCHNKFKQRLWKETCTEVFSNWESMSMLKRIEYGRELQKRWKNLRTCFAREMALQKKEHKDIMDRREVKIRKRYEYFNRMLFLLNDEQKKKMEQIMAVTSLNSNDVGDDNSEINNDHSEINNDTTLKTEYYNEYDDDDNIMVIEPQEPQKVEDLLQNAEEAVDENVNCDEDKLFLMSLLKTFRKFDDRQRFAAKIQILMTLRKIQFPDD